MSCENCANAYDEGYTAGHNAENARLREQVEALAGAIQRENGVCVWEQTDTCTGQHFPHTCFRPLLHEAADAALRAYREANHE